METREFWIRSLFLSICGVAALCRGDAQDEAASNAAARARQNQGLYNEMVERHAAWRKAHDPFDASIATLIKRAAAGSKDTEKNRVLNDLCGSPQRSRLDSAILLLQDQLQAQERYFKREENDAARAVAEENRVIANRRELESQRQTDVKNAEKELQFLRGQYTETESTRESARDNPDRLKNLEHALEQLNKAIRVRSQKVDQLKSTEGFNQTTLESLEITRQRIEERRLQNEDNVSLIDATRVYYEAYC